MSDQLRRHGSVSDFSTQVGVYFPEGAEVPRTDQVGFRWIVTGTVDTCERSKEESKRRVAREPREEGIIKIVLPTGYCHSRSGPFIDATAAVQE
ncbi:MAG TPA: hypothetical protein VFH89_03295 [Sphingomicrobium sp.]|nr:hypothetical protein [Sphingomicrobium sp.]